MNDKELLGYLETHCRTDLGLVHKDHLKRLFELAGEPKRSILRLDQGTWWSTSPEALDPIIERARKNLNDA